MGGGDGGGAGVRDGGGVWGWEALVELGGASVCAGLGSFELRYRDRVGRQPGLLVSVLR